ncbi:hypothetical protein JJL45_13680 [Tamlana sp. s12]|uniref:lipocalin family protein n=1 Tax=Tamlana sp. s12 TaxID=1630406 RepID=UPI000801C33E|nr:lipocalin family protein [Tamlana sp. s12]OBQ56416.1 hypothetical protein VQ01_03430 [Tamlana sp. s12]QQY81960.1 hypothetical protein JJL45_13680 [Tamlana sp. s12]
MKYKYSFLLLLLILINCEKSNEPLISEETLIVGKWELTEAYISAGGPQYWIDVENGHDINFLENGTFTSSRFTECTTGNFSINENKLLLKYNCQDFHSESENEQGYITYDLEFYSDYFIVSPTSGPICNEGCSYKYQKK